MKGKRKGNYNPKRDGRNPRGRASREDEVKDRYAREDVNAKNDISWYSRNPNLLIAAGSFPYPYRPGMDMNIGSAVVGTGDGAATVQQTFTIPGVLALDWIPNVGNASQPSDPVNVLAKELYARIRKNYSGSLEADAPDLAIYLMALDSIFSYIAWLKRLYRCLNAWTPENHVLPDVVMQAMWRYGLDIQELRQHRTEFWQNINELILQSRKFACPAVMDVFNRHYWMSDNLYTDDNRINSQFYLFNLRACFKFKLQPIPGDETNTAAGLEVVQLPIGNGNKAVPVADYYQFGLSLINALAEWDTGYTISGYFMRAFEGAPSFAVAELAADEVLTPVYEEEVLSQIENSRSISFANGVVNPFKFCTIAQDPITNSIVSNFTFLYRSYEDPGFARGTQAAYNAKPVLSIRSDNPTVADSVLASRLQAMQISATSPVTGFDAFTVDAGTEIPLNWTLYTGVWTPGSQVERFEVPQMIVSTTAQPVALTPYLAMEQFDWHPFIWATIQSGSAYVTAPLGDTHNITVIERDDLANLHKICLYSEYNSFGII